MDKDSKLIIIIGGLIGIALVGSVIYSVKNNSLPSELDGFATCLKDSGATFYGAFWCPHCKSQKELFGRSASKLPYVECSVPSGDAQTPVCKTANIESYPTWNFKEGIKVTSATDPIICEKKPGIAGENAVCKTQASETFKKWIFSNITVVSSTDPKKEGNLWSFATSSFTQGELSLKTLATQTGCELPEAKK